MIDGPSPYRRGVVDPEVTSIMPGHAVANPRPVRRATCDSFCRSTPGDEISFELPGVSVSAYGHGKVDGVAFDDLGPGGRVLQLYIIRGITVVLVNDAADDEVGPYDGRTRIGLVIAQEVRDRLVAPR